MTGGSLATRLCAAFTNLLRAAVLLPYSLLMHMAQNKAQKPDAVEAPEVQSAAPDSAVQPSPAGPPLTELARDMIICKLSYLSAIDLSAASVTSRLMLLLVGEVQRKPGVVTEIGPPSEVLSALKKRLIATPTLGFLFGTGDLSDGSVSEVLCKGLPLGCHVIGANSQQLQALVQTQASSTELRHLQGAGQVTLMLGSFPDAVAQPFYLNPAVCSQIAEGGLQVLQQRGLPVGEEWKTIVLIVGDMRRLHVDPSLLVQAFQSGSSDTAILGGISGQQILLHSRGCTAVHQEGVVGLALKGEVPLTALVSRGCKPLTPVMQARGTRTLVRHDQDFFEIPQLVSEESGVMSPLQVAINCQRKAPYGMFAGMRLRGDGGFYLEQVGRQSFSPKDESMLVPFMGTKEEEEHLADSQCSVRFFTLDADECKADVERLLGYVRQQCEEGDEEVLGAVMFTCAGRTASFFSEDFVDTKKFQSVFPSIPLVGFWAMGEIGPVALAEAKMEEACRSGNAELQGFTAVFGIFRAPVPKMRSTLINLPDEEVPAAVGELLRRWGSAAKDRGNSAFKEGDAKAAKVHYTRALALASLACAEVPEHERAAVFANRAQASLKVGDAESALADAEATLEMVPQHVKGLYRRAQALLQLDRAAEAAAGLREAIPQVEDNLAFQDLLKKAETAASK